MSNKDQAIEMLREFATFQGMGVRGVIRMRGMQLRATTLLAKIDKVKARRKKKPKATGWFVEALRKHNGVIVDSAGFNEIFKQIALDNLEKVLPEFSWVDLREEALENKWFEEIGERRQICIKVPNA